MTEQLRTAPSLCNSSFCVGCGNEKMYRGRTASSFVCCNSCWKIIPDELRQRFLTDETRLPESPHGATVAEREIALFLSHAKQPL